MAFSRWFEQGNRKHIEKLWTPCQYPLRHLHPTHGYKSSTRFLRDWISAQQPEKRVA